MKKIITVAIILAMICCFCACNKQVIDLNYKFNRAEIRHFDGSVEFVDVAKWNDYEDGDVVQIITNDGKKILTHYCNVILYEE